MQTDKNLDWREGLLDRVRIVLFAVLAFSAFITVIAARTHSMLLIAAIATITSLTLIILIAARGISLFVRSLTVVVVIACTAIFSYWGAGYLAGPAATAAFALVIAALLFGRRAFITLLIVFSTMPFIAAFLVGQGFWEGPPSTDFDPQTPLTWVRTGLISIVMWGAAGFAVLFVKDTIEGNLAQKEAALSRLRAEEEARSRAEETAAQAQKLDAVGRLAAGIAHDFNNALLVVQGWNELRAGANETELEKEAGESIDKAVEQGAFLARQLLTFARKDVRTPRALSIDDIVADTAATLGRLLPANIMLHVETASGETVYADEAQLQQVIINVAINSRDALPEGGAITISTHRSEPPEGWSSDDNQEPPAGWVAVDVADNGVGMDEQIRQLVFEPFFTTKERGQGTGLGLATSYGIIRQSGGHISIDSTKGQGTTVTLYLPTTAAPPDSAGQSSLEPSTSKLPVRTFVVEDSPEALKFMTHMMENHGMSVTAAADGDAALEQLAADSEPYDFLVCDAVFPGAPMADVIDAFRRHSPDAPILICSGYVREGLAMASLEGSKWDFLGKPFGIEEFNEKARALLKS